MINLRAFTRLTKALPLFSRPAVLSRALARPFIPARPRRSLSSMLSGPSVGDDWKRYSEWRALAEPNGSWLTNLRYETEVMTVPATEDWRGRSTAGPYH
jgi:hypothetical protein